MRSLTRLNWRDIATQLFAFRINSKPLIEFGGDVNTGCQPAPVFGQAVNRGHRHSQLPCVGSKRAEARRPLGTIVIVATVAFVAMILLLRHFSSRGEGHWLSIPQNRNQM